MQNILILKTPGGRTLGHARMSGGTDACSIVLTGEKKQAAHIVALNASCCAAVESDAQGRIDAPFLPDALVLLGARGEIEALAAAPGRHTEAALRAQRYIARTTQRDGDEPLPKTPPETPPEPKKTDADSPNDGAHDAPPSDAHRGEPARENPLAAQRAWPPPPFFPAARFTDGAWRT